MSLKISGGNCFNELRLCGIGYNSNLDCVWVMSFGLGSPWEPRIILVYKTILGSQGFPRPKDI